MSEYHYIAGLGFQLMNREEHSSVCSNPHVILMCIRIGNGWIMVLRLKNMSETPGNPGKMDICVQ